MSSEREKLIEVWLDSATERQYQFAFRNALLSEGYTIIHDTSHVALELGKDVIATSPKGKLFAYQLKGNPGGRITISEWQSLIAQINTLIYQPVSHPSVRPTKPHTPVLVTNGEIHEDVYAAITAFNRSISGPRARPLETIARGQLLRRILDTAETIWPVDVPTQRRLLNIFAASGDDELPLAEFVELINQILNTAKYSPAAIPAVNLVVSILASNWVGKQNYFELIKMYVLTAVAVACYQARWSRDSKKDDRYLDEILFDIRGHLKSLIQDLQANFGVQPLINSDIFAEFAYYHPRKKMISGLLSAAALDEGLELDSESREFIWDFICNRKHSQFMIWEGIIPYCLAEIWALSNIQGTNDPDRRVFALVRDIIVCNNSDIPKHHLPGPHYRLDEVLLWKYGDYLKILRSGLERDSFYRRSWFLEPLFHMLVRRNYKPSCKSLWPELTRFVHCRTRLNNAIDFGRFETDNAVAEDKIIETSRPKLWTEAIAEACQRRKLNLPPQLIRRPILVLLYCFFAPHRMHPDVIFWLDRKFCRTWY